MATKTKSKADNKLAAYGVTEASLQEIAERRTDATKILAFLQGAKITSPARRAWASEQLSNVRALLKSLEDQRTAITKPINAAKRGVDALFTPTTSVLKQCEDQLREMLRGYDVGVLRAEREAALEAQAAYARGDVEAGNAALDRVPEASAEASGHSSSLTWSFVVESFAELPDEHKLVNERSLAALVKAHVATGSTEPPSVPGVRFELAAAIRAKAV